MKRACKENMNRRIRKELETSEDEVDYLGNKLKNLNIAQEKRDINILLLGETGVGKSTFINAFFNYLQYPTFKKARKGKLLTLIPAKFTITDENYEERVVQVGEDKNESIEVGASATQSCKSYVYCPEDGKLKIRLIDTPGIGDTRGINQDNINFENILSFIGEIKHLNAICILLKPNNSRLTVMFEFCIKQLLSRLEKSASRNLIFIFTNTRSTFYRPGETLPSLKKLLNTIDGVQIPLTKENIYCTDNEAFRFLAAVNNGVHFSSIDVDNFAQSWIKSVHECWRMITYITGDSNKIALVPHDVKNTISVNEARRLIVQLSQPLADIAQLIQDNIYVLERHKLILYQSNNTLTDLKTKLFIPVVNLRVTQMDQPTTVCTSTKCSTVYKIGDKQKWHYHQKCHSPCYLSNVPKEIIGTPELAHCSAMAGTGICTKCSCRYQVHMHIYYETQTYEDKLEDESVKQVIMDKEIALIQARNLVIKISRHIEEYKTERNDIIKTTAKFACFLKANAIAPYNDAYKAYLEYLIDREKSMGDVADADTIQQFQQMLLKYNEEKNTLLSALQQNSPNVKFITADDIINCVQSLYNLKYNGAKIKELFEMQKQARKDENQSETREVVYGGPPKHIEAKKRNSHNESVQNRNPRPRSHSAHQKHRARNFANSERYPNYHQPHQSNQPQNYNNPQSSQTNYPQNQSPMQFLQIKQDGTGYLDLKIGQTDRDMRSNLRNPQNTHNQGFHQPPHNVPMNSGQRSGNQGFYQAPRNVPMNSGQRSGNQGFYQAPRNAPMNSGQRSGNQGPPPLMKTGIPSNSPRTQYQTNEFWQRSHQRGYDRHGNQGFAEPFHGAPPPYNEARNFNQNQYQRKQTNTRGGGNQHRGSGGNAASNHGNYHSEPEARYRQLARGRQNQRSSGNNRRHFLHDTSSDSDESVYHSSTNFVGHRQ